MADAPLPPSGTVENRFVLVGDLPVKKWRCTHGHKWEHAAELVGVKIWGECFGLPDGESLSFCGLCLVEVMKEKLGQVREDT
jgi:hypothetical protein